MCFNVTASIETRKGFSGDFNVSFNAVSCSMVIKHFWNRYDPKALKLQLYRSILNIIII